MFDSAKSGSIEKEKVRTILNTLGHTFDDHELEVLLKQEDEEGIVFPEFPSDAIFNPCLITTVFRRTCSNARAFTNLSIDGRAFADRCSVRPNGAK